MPFTLYVALGDSMSTDHYPTCDVRNLDAPPARLDPLGAASLLYRNDDVRWPEFRGRDLMSHARDAEFLNLAEDGAMIDDVATEELARLGRDSGDPGILITLTAGGNDLLDALAAGRRLDTAVRQTARRYTDLVETIREELPRATLLLSTVYDPTDNTGRLPGLEAHGRLPLEHLERFNAEVHRTAESMPRVLVADVHRHFLGHGLKAREEDRWYWRRNLIEPNAPGASEIRRVWWETLEGIAYDRTINRTTPERRRQTWPPPTSGRAAPAARGRLSGIAKPGMPTETRCSRPPAGSARSSGNTQPKPSRIDVFRPR
jgi:lysophospholipase L1-like esterase